MPETIRLFFALWPDQAVRGQLMDHAIKTLSVKNARLTRKLNLHLTLHFIGNTTTDMLPCYIQQARSVRFQAFNISLDTVDYFKKQKIVWIGSKQIPEQLLRLHDDLGKALKHCNYLAEARQYRPHVTLYRKAKLTASLEVPEIKWNIEHFSLIKSEPDKDGVLYTEIERFKCG